MKITGTIKGPQMSLDLTNQKFGRLQVLWETTETSGGNKLWLCECDCGKIIRVGRQNLQNNHTKSCGCLSREKASEWGKIIGKRSCKHGDARPGKITKLYKVWMSMRSRCFKENSAGYKYYGGKGRVMCSEWNEDYSVFKKWALANGYKEGLSIDRINHRGNYEPSNCQWLTRSENAKKQWRDV